MRQNALRWIGGMVLGLVLVWRTAPAQDEFAAGSFDPMGETCDSCGSGDCDGSCDGGCYDPCAGPCRSWSWYAGFDFVFVRPQFENNTGMVINTSDDDTFSVFDNQSFDYDFNLSPRVWLGYEWSNGLGMRTRFWNYDQTSNTLAASPSADGFGTVFSPIEVDNQTNVPSTSIPTDRFIATSDLEATFVDLEGTKQIHFDHWSLMVTSGIRYGGIRQSYDARVVSANNVLRDRSDFGHRFDGAGPTFSFEARRPVTRFLAAYSAARGSLLFGHGKSSLTAQEDLDLASPFTTVQTSTRDDLMPIAEIQIGAEWTRRLYYGGLLFFRGAFEGQLWQGAGNATSEEGDLGFLGASFTLGLDF